MAEQINVHVLQDPRLIFEARQLQGNRYLEAGFVEALDAGDVVDDKWVDVATYFGALDAATAEVVGVSRLIPFGPAGLPMLEAFELTSEGAEIMADIVPAGLLEVSALAVSHSMSRFGAGRVANALYRAMYQYSVVGVGRTHWCASLDVRVKTHLENIHNFLFREIAEPAEYLGSLTVPVTLDLLGQARHFAATAPERNQFFLAGLEIDLTGETVRLNAGSGEFMPTVAQPIG